MPHPNLRAVWRVFEIAIIAEQAGKPFDKVPLVLRILRQSDRSQRPGSL
jgi:hypothetical protein